MNNKKFIITQDKNTADKMINCGFRLLSNVGGVYTFINDQEKHFNFSSTDTTKVHFTNILNI